MEDDIIKSIKNCKIFASLDPHGDVFQALLTQFEKIHLSEGEYLFHQGDPSEDLYILMSGRLGIIASATDSKPRVVDYIVPYDPVGELGSLSGDPRSATIKAVEDSYLLKLQQHTFKRLCNQYPAILFSVIGHSQQIIHSLSVGEKKKHIAIIPANQYVALEKFEEKLKEIISHYKKIALLSETDIQSDKQGIIDVEELINHTEKHNVIIIYLLKTVETPLSQACWGKIGKIYVVADGNTRPHFDSLTLEKLHNTKHLVEVRRELILLYKGDTPPYNTQEWLNKATFFLHHHIRINHTSDYQRLVRFMREKAFGLVLSGGGARGWAHLGVLRALLEFNIPIDAIGGTSAGGLIGSLYALTNNYEETYKYFDTLLEKSQNIVTWRNFTWPAISMFNCKDFTNQLKKIFGTHKIENLWLPFFCITCNLGHYKEVAHYHGYLWEKNRGSVAVPGLVPPMVINGELHIDGGVVNNLPVDTMRDLLGKDSKIIAVELISDLIDNKQYYFPPTMGFKEALLAKIGLGYSNYKFPRFLETFLKSLLIGSSVKQQENADSADLLINPHVSTYGMIRLNKKQDRNELIELGYKTAFEKLSTWEFKK